MLRAGLLPSVAWLAVAGCSSGPAARGAPDLALVEICPPSGPPDLALVEEQKPHRIPEPVPDPPPPDLAARDAARDLAPPSGPFDAGPNTHPANLPPPPQFTPKQLKAKAARRAVEAACAALVARVAAGPPYLDAPELAAPQRLYGHQVRDELALFAPAAYRCVAVANDSDGPCGALAGERKKECAAERSLFHAARRAPGDGTWRATDESFEACRSAGRPLAVCTGYRDALRARDPGRCPQDAPLCRALAAVDERRCPAGEKRCPGRVARYRLLGEGGLARLAAEGAPEDRVLAAAALGGSDACTPLLDELARHCMPPLAPPDGEKAPDEQKAR